MPRLGTFCRLAPLLLMLASPAYGGEPGWVEVRSPHFSVVTDAGEKRGREVALRFEQMRAVFGALMTKARVNLPIPLQIVAFRSGKEMRQYVPLWKGKPTQVAGLFEGSNDRCFILLDMSVDDPWQVVFHEYAHQLLNGNTSARFQPWFDEGFAEFFSTIKINGKEADIGLLPENEIQILQQMSLAPVAKLFRVQQNSSTYNESGDHRSLFYAESWLIVHYLYDQRLMTRLNRYFELAVDKGVPVEDAIQQAFGMSAAEFDRTIHQYLASGRILYHKLTPPAGIESSSYRAKPLTAPDAEAVLADMHFHSPDYQEKAVAEFEEVLKVQPDNVAALRGLGYAYLMKKDYSRAGEYFRKAVEHDTDDPRLLYYSALAIEQEEGPGMGNDREELVVIQNRLEKAVALDPEFSEAYSLLAYTYVSQGKREEALKTMEQAVNLNPRSLAYAMNLAQMYMTNQKFDQAIGLLQQLSQASDAHLAAQAAETLAVAQSAKEAVAAGASVRIQAGPAGKQELVIRQVAGPTASQEKAEDAAVLNVPGAAGFLRGKLLAVDCSAKPAAVLTVTAAGKTWKFHARDSTRVIVVGADKFSCDWSNVKVAINYRQTGEQTGEIISLELQ